ncbi:MAG: ParB/RepB/Spo0J family partition protein [Candidatus Sumerlaeota bacterium]
MQTETQPETGLVELPVGQIRPNLNQPRSEFNEEGISELADSIREVGVLQPLLVRKQDDHYELIAGERRFRASKIAGLEAVPCRLTEVSDERSFEMAIIENLQREDLNPMEEARAFRSLIEQFDLSQQEAAHRVGKQRSTVANALRLLHLPKDIQEDVESDQLSPGHARAILSLEEAPKQRALRNMIVSNGLSVRQAEVEARKLAEKLEKKPEKKTNERDAQLRDLEESFSLKLGLPVKIHSATAKKGKVQIAFQSLDEFDRITDFFGVEA